MDYTAGPSLVQVLAARIYLGERCGLIGEQASMLTNFVSMHFSRLQVGMDCRDSDHGQRQKKRQPPPSMR